MGYSYRLKLLQLYGTYEGGAKVYINPDLKGTDMLYLTLGHEYVHYLQDYLGEFETDDCGSEKEAFDLEVRMARDMGLSPALPDYWELLKSQYGCK